MKKFFKLIIFIFVLLLFPIKSYATNLDSININVKLQDNGDAIFSSEFVYDDNEGTEHFFIVDSLAGSEIKDFSVTRNDIPMKFEENWNVESSFEEKKDKFGIVKTSTGYELCYGITEYDNNKFVLNYTITNFVHQLEDTQMMYWKFISANFQDNPDNVRITIEKEGYDFLDSNADIWAFGYKGSIIFDDGKIIADSNGILPSGNKMTVLTKFDENIFTPISKIDKDFMYYKKIAFEGSKYDINEEGKARTDLNDSNDSNNRKSSSNNKIGSSIIGILGALVAIVIALLLRWQGKRVKSDNYKGIAVDRIKINIKDYKGQYFREIPYEGDLSDLYLLIKKGWNKEFENYMTVYFLKWIKDEKIQVIKEKKGLIFKKDEVNFQILDKEYYPDSYLEKQLFSYMIQSTKGTNIVESKTFSKWMGNNDNLVDDLINEAEDLSREKLTQLGYFKEEVQINRFSKYRNTILTEKGRELVGNLAKFQNYLKDYSLLNERDSYDVHIWDEYMIYAALFGITKEVENEFKNIYPEYIDESYFDFYTIYYISQISSRAYNSYTAASAAESSGSGGFSSIGGGGGSFGGGGGGTR